MIARLQSFALLNGLRLVAALSSLRRRHIHIVACRVAGREVFDLAKGRVRMVRVEADRWVVS